MLRGSLKNLFTLFLAISTSLSSSAFAGAWLQDEGHGQIIATTRFYGTSQVFDNHGERDSIPLFTKTDIGPYFEYGVNDEFTLGGEINWAAATNAGNSTSSVGSATDSFNVQYSYGELFGRAYLYHGDAVVVSVEPSIDFPARIDPDLTSDGRHPIPAIKLSAGYGYNRWEQNNFMEASIKYRYRNLGDLNDMIKTEATLGYHITDYFIGIGQISYETTLGSTRSPGNYDLLKPQVSVLYDEREHFSYQLGAFTNISGRNTGAGYGVTYSVWYRF